MARDSGLALLVDSAMRVRMAAPLGGDGPAVEVANLVGSSLPEALDAVSDAIRIERAMRRAIRGSEGALTLADDAGTRTIRFAPLAGELAGGAAGLVVVRPQRDSDREADGLRDRVTVLEALVTASGALARGTYAEEVRATIREQVPAVSGCDVVALLEPDETGETVAVAAASGADLEGRSVSSTQAALSAGALLGDAPSFHADLRRRGSAAAWPLLQAGCVAGIWLPITRAAGDRLVVALGWREPIADPGPSLLGDLARLAEEAAVALDRAGAIEQLSEMARTDPLTAISNRRAWEDELVRELSRAQRLGQPLSVGLIDIDELKAFNDRWGHAGGDRLLLTAAARWRRRLRLTDVLARVGGDEFGFILPGCKLARAATLGDELRGVLPDGVSCSIGVAEWLPGEDAAALLARADEALYAAKRAGRDATFSLQAAPQGAVGGSVP